MAKSTTVTSALGWLALTGAVTIFLSLASAQDFQGITIDRMRDGDTFCAGDLCIRPRCIDTPEVGEEGFHEATDDAAELVMGVTVTLTGPFRKD